jgi:carbamoyl-phosphate synthase large subunit
VCIRVTRSLSPRPRRLTDKEYQILRNASIAVLREIGVDTGGSNVQFSINPDDGRMVVIEMNPRVSRSSALASKATGFPIAKIAAKLAIGYTLDELANDITGGKTPASFEPSIDYVVTKVPRFAFEKFPQADNTLTTQMKSVGEVMAIGRTFQESLQKALRGLEVGVDGFNLKSVDPETIDEQLARPTPDRLWYVADAFGVGMSVEKVFDLTKIDPWFLVQIKELVDLELEIEKRDFSTLTAEELRFLKRKGFADRRLAHLTKISETAVRERRHELGVRPVYKRVDTCAAEFSTDTAYMYSTYEDECEAKPTDKKKIMVLGGGPNRIGQGIEFDYCCVHAAMAMREDGYETIMVNCNPGNRFYRLRHLGSSVFRAADAGRCAGNRRHRKAGWRHRSVRRPDPAKIGAGARSQRRADHRHLAGIDRYRRRSRTLSEAAA